MVVVLMVLEISVSGKEKNVKNHNPNNRSNCGSATGLK